MAQALRCCTLDEYVVWAGFDNPAPDLFCLESTDEFCAVKQAEGLCVRVPLERAPCAATSTTSGN